MLFVFFRARNYSVLLCKYSTVVDTEASVLITDLEL